MDIEVGLDPTPNAREAILSGLVRYNERFLGPLVRRTPLVVTARDASGTIIGGATGSVYYDRLSIELLWVDEPHRSEGLGSKILREIEAQGRTLGATRAFLDTFTFQAAPFYEKHGYVEVARVTDYWEESDRIYLAKASL